MHERVEKQTKKKSKMKDFKWNKSFHRLFVCFDAFRISQDIFGHDEGEKKVKFFALKTLFSWSFSIFPWSAMFKIYGFSSPFNIVLKSAFHFIFFFAFYFFWKMKKTLPFRLLHKLFGSDSSLNFASLSSLSFLLTGWLAWLLACLPALNLPFYGKMAFRPWCRM